MIGLNEKVVSSADAASYIEQVSTELGDLAKRNRLDFLHYLIDMARQEAALEAAKSMVRAKAAAGSR